MDVGTIVHAALIQQASSAGKPMTVTSRTASKNYAVAGRPGGKTINI